MDLPLSLLTTIAVMLVAVYLFITEKLRVDVVALLVMTALLVLGVLSVPEALSGFSNQATVMVACMFVLSGALKANGALVAIGELLSRIRWRWLFLLVMLGLVVSVAAFINNTATVAVFLPLVLVATAANGWAPSKFLIPLSYISQTAGVCTLIGTSTNLLVDSMARDAAGVGFTIFEFAPLGIIFVGICSVYLLTVGWWILPNRGTPNPGETEHVGRFIAELVVPADTPVIGTSPRKVLPDSADDVELLEVLRNGVAQRDPDVTIQAGDRLLLRGLWPRIEAARKAMKCKFDRVPKAPDRAPPPVTEGDEGDKPKESDAVRRDERLHVEAMVAPGSHLIGRTLHGMRFAHTYRARVQGIHRRQLAIRVPLDRVPLSVGDVLMLDAPVDAIDALRADPGMIVLGERAQERVAPKRAIVSALIMFAAIGVAALGWLPVAAAALLLAVRLWQSLPLRRGGRALAGAALALALALALPALLGALPRWLIPGRWADAAFWRGLGDTLAETLNTFLHLPGTARDGLLARTLLGAAACLAALPAGLLLVFAAAGRNTARPGSSPDQNTGRGT